MRPWSFVCFPTDMRAHFFWKSRSFVFLQDGLILFEENFFAHRRWFDFLFFNVSFILTWIHHLRSRILWPSKKTGVSFFQLRSSLIHLRSSLFVLKSTTLERISTTLERTSTTLILWHADNADFDGFTQIWSVKIRILYVICVLKTLFTPYFSSKNNLSSKRPHAERTTLVPYFISIERFMGLHNKVIRFLSMVGVPLLPRLFCLAESKQKRPETLGNKVKIWLYQIKQHLRKKICIHCMKHNPRVNLWLEIPLHYALFFHQPLV